MSLFLPINPNHSPNEGREIINYNFSLITGATAVTIGYVSVTANSSNVIITSGISSPNIYYGVDINPNLTLTSLSAISISASTIFSGSTNLGDLLTGLTTGYYLPLSGGTVSGDTIFTQGLSSNTFTANTIYSISGISIGTLTPIFPFHLQQDQNSYTNALVQNGFTGPNASANFVTMSDSATGFLGSSSSGSTGTTPGVVAVGSVYGDFLVIAGSQNVDGKIRFLISGQTSEFEKVTITDTGAGFGTTNPLSKVHVSGGTIRINTLNSSEGLNKIAVSDAVGNISFSSTTDLNIGGGAFSGWTASTGINSIIANNNTGNKASGNFSIVGGQSNSGSSNFDTIINGQFNVSSGYQTFIGNGIFNLASGSRSAIVIGNENSATTGYSVIVGGRKNKSSGVYSFIGNGYQNSASTNHSIIVGGRQNRTSGFHSFIGTGYQNSATTKYSTVVNGFKNKTDGYYSSIVGGIRNTASTYSSFVGGGSFNRANGNYSSIVGGQENLTNANHSFIGGGLTNVIYSASKDSFIGAGNNNKISSTNVYGSSFIGAGASNSALTSYSSVVGGYKNIANGGYSFIGGGLYNATSGNSATVGGGRQNKAYANYSFVGGGFNNRAYSGQSSIVGGTSNTAKGLHSFIGGGYQNTAFGFSSVVIGGLYNLITGTYSFIGGGGGSNFVSGNYSSVISGILNSATTGNSMIVGGRNNLAAGQYSSIINGSGNTITGIRSAIIGGINITGTSNDTVYVPFFNIKSANTNNALTNILVKDTNGDVYLRDVNTLSGGSMSGNFLPISGGTVTGNTIFTTGVTANTLTLTNTPNAALNIPILTADPGTLSDGDVWIFSGNTGNAILKVRIGGLTKGVELT